MAVGADVHEQGVAVEGVGGWLAFPVTACAGRVHLDVQQLLAARAGRTERAGPRFRSLMSQAMRE